MSDFHDYGPLLTFELTWATGHIERVQAHQVTWPQNATNWVEQMTGMVDTKATTVRFVHFHGEFDGKWQLVLSARESDLRTIRNVTADEPVPGELS